MRIKELTEINKKHIALMDNTSISFLQGLNSRGIKGESVLDDYELIVIPRWVLNEIEDSDIRSEYVQNLIDKGYPIFYVSEERYSELAEGEEGNLYQIVLASVSMLGRLRAYLRRFVEKNNELDMESYDTWINKFYDEWPIPGETLLTGRVQKKNAGEISITILTEVISWYYPETKELTIYSQDRDAFEFQRNAEESLRKIFSSRIPALVSYKSNDAILCQLFRDGVIGTERVHECRKDARRLTYTREQHDHSVVLVTELIDNESFIKLIEDDTIHIIF